MLCIQEELGQLGPTVGNGKDSQIARVPNTRTESENNTKSSDSATKCGQTSGTLDTPKTSWVEGVLGCMRPVFALLSKVGGNDKIKGNPRKFNFPFSKKNLQINTIRHVHSGPKLSFHQNFSTSRYNKSLKKFNYINRGPNVPDLVHCLFLFFQHFDIKSNNLDK